MTTDDPPHITHSLSHCYNRSMGDLYYFVLQLSHFVKLYLILYWIWHYVYIIMIVVAWLWTIKFMIQRKIPSEPQTLYCHRKKWTQKPTGKSLNSISAWNKWCERTHCSITRGTELSRLTSLWKWCFRLKYNHLMTTSKPYLWPSLQY